MHNQESSVDSWIMATLLVVRLAFLLFSPAGLSGEAYVEYVQAAHTIIDTGRLPPLFVQPRGYPVLIAPLLYATGDGFPRAVLVMNSMMDCSVVAILFHCAKHIFPLADQRGVRLLCWLLTTIQPFTAEMIITTSTDTVVMFLNFVGIWLLFASRSFKWTACALALMGVASLLRIDILVLNAICVIIYFVFFEGMKCGWKTALKGYLVFLAFPGLMLVYQFYSTHEVGFVRWKEPWSPGYYAWMRTWFALEKSEYDRFAFNAGTRDWSGFEVSNYPPRAFDSIAERDRVSELLKTWRSEGYSAKVEQGFRGVAHKRLVQHPLRSLLLVPSLRTIHFWINIDGAQSYLRVLLIQKPYSTLVVAFTLLLRLFLLFMAAFGSYAIWFRPRTPVTDQLRLARFASFFAAARTMELGALGVFVGAGLMEVRYIVVAFPFVILLSFWGLRFFLEGKNPRS